MNILTGVKANKYRENYINAFVNKNSEIYLNHICVLNKYIDGYCYDAYLWDSLKNPCVKTEKDCMKLLKSYENLYAFWDIHSCEKIVIPNYWKFPKSAVVNLTYLDFLAHINDFPEDIYFFDETYSWSVVLTHEYIAKERFCYICWSQS